MKKTEILKILGKPKIDKEWDDFLTREIAGSKRYKLRAETPRDVCDFLVGLKKKIWRIKLEQPDNLPDCDFEFSCYMTLDEIITILRKIPDSHVMIQTINLIDEYTGERNFDIDC